MSPRTHYLNKAFLARNGLKSMPSFGQYQKWKIAKLAETIAWAAHNAPFYKKVQGRALIIASKLEKLATNSKNIADDKALFFASKYLADLDFFTKSADITTDSLAFLAVGQDDVEGLVTVPTSGTSGTSKRIYSSADDLEETIKFFEYGMRILVSPPYDRVALAMSPARPGNVGDLLGRALARWNIDFIAHGFIPKNEKEESDWLKQLLEWRPTCLVGVPAQILSLSRKPEAKLLNGLKSILLSGDVASDGLVKELENNFLGCRVFRHYGLSECGLGGAVECEFRQWPHLRDDLWLEIISPQGEVLAPGQTGEICLTPLTRRAMPLLRYRTGDEGLIINESCPCGAITARLKIFGRLNDSISINGKNINLAEFEAPLLKLNFVRDYNVSLKEADKNLNYKSNHQYCSEMMPLQGLEIIIKPTEYVPKNAMVLAKEAIDGFLGDNANFFEIKIRLDNKEFSEKNIAGGKRHLKKLI